MVISRCIMLLALTVLAYLLYTTVLTSNNGPDVDQSAADDAIIIADPGNITKDENTGKFTNTNKINYERLENTENPASVGENVTVSEIPSNNEEPAPVAAPAAAPEIIYDADDINEDVVKVEGTDLLVAPLADRYQAVNSIANVNRNASNDLRGDIAIPYDENYSPWYQSAIVGEPLHTNPLQ